MLTWVNPYYAILYAVMFLLSIGYYHGLKWFFRYNFKSDYAAVTGIVVTTCITAVGYWQVVYGRDVAVDITLSLFFAFAGALPLMMRFRGLLEKDAAEKRAYRKQLEQYVLDSQKQHEQMKTDIEQILQSAKATEYQLAEVLAVTSFRELAQRYLDSLATRN